MYLAGPLISNELLLGRVGVAATLGAVGVFAKEFAAAPLYLLTAYAAVERRSGPTRPGGWQPRTSHSWSGWP